MRERFQARQPKKAAGPFDGMNEAEDVGENGGVIRFLLETYELDDPALQQMARVIHAADLPQDEPSNTLAPGVLAIFDGIRDSDSTDDERLTRGFVVCDALYEYCKQSKRKEDDE